MSAFVGNQTIEHVVEELPLSESACRTVRAGLTILELAVPLGTNRAHVVITLVVHRIEAVQR